MTTDKILNFLFFTDEKPFKYDCFASAIVNDKLSLKIQSDDLKILFLINIFPSTGGKSYYQCHCETIYSIALYPREYFLTNFYAKIPRADEGEKISLDFIITETDSGMEFL